MKVGDFIHLNQGSMSFEEYFLQFSMLSRYAPYLVSNPRNEMTTCVMGVIDLERVECHTVMLNYDMTLARLVVYAQSIKELKLGRIFRNLKRRG